jgi:hypothetical protein
MRVSEIQVLSSDRYCELRGRVESDIDPDDAQWWEPFDLWYRFPLWCEPFMSAENGDPFLVALLVGAMRTEPRLANAAPVSPRLLEALPDIQAIYAAFDSRAKRITVEAATREESLPATPEPGVGLFFSLGVDSFYSLLKLEREHPADEHTITHLLTVHGIDVPFEEWDEEFPRELLRNATRVAAETGKTLIPVITNVRRATPALGPWPMLHGGGTIGAALALGAALRRVLIAASTTYDRLYPWGSHPVLDRLWSTENLTVVHDGCEMNTIDKTRYIAESRPRLVLETLRPCAGYGPGYNCGACLKCMRTMIDLLQFGYLDRCRTLPHEIDVERFREVLRPGGPVHVADFTRRLQALEAQGLAPGVQRVLREHLTQGMAPRWYAAAGPRPASQRSRLGLVDRFLRRLGDLAP